MLNNYIIPIVVLIIVFYGYIKKCDIYEDFLMGCVDGLKILVEIIPTILAMIFAVNIFIECGILNLITGSYKDIVPMVILKPVSGNATLVFLNNIYKIYGVDSFLGYLASVIQGSTDTTIYILALYFGSVKIKKTRYALLVGLFADFCGISAAFLIVHLFFA